MAHSYETKVKAALAYVLYGSVGAAARAVGLPKTSVANWLPTQEWAELVRSLRKEHEAELEAGLSRILRTALDDLLSRVEKGNASVDKKTGEITYTPLSASELCLVLNTVSKMQERIKIADEMERGVSRLERIAELLRARGIMIGEDLLAPVEDAPAPV